MMLPVAAAAATRFSGTDENGNFRTALMLAVAYGASIGGIATLVGSPPNMILAGMVRTLTGSEISFVRWVSFAAPIAGILLLLTWLYLTFFAFPQVRGGEPVVIDDQIRALGPVSAEERKVAGVFLLTAALWMSRAFWGPFLPMISDAGIAVFGAVLLFLIPSGGSRLLVWDDAVRLPWAIVLLFGCGFALAKGFMETGLEGWIADRLTILSGASPILVLLAVIILIIFLTEVTSNTATATIFIPVVAALGTVAGTNPLMLLVAVTLASSLAFMLPVGTPPNAIVYGSGWVTMPQMVRAGFWMNLISIAVLMICVPLFIG
jgi:sodium-dependent dicarboxylate transporter 2/3/5